ncbi:MAG: HAD-IIIA family hydrolase [Candidatus Brocadiia bacterium]
MRLLHEEARERARSVRLVIMDVDGVLTDGRVLYSADREGVLFNVHDGTGIKYLHRCGIQTALVTGRNIQAVRRRAESLGIPHLVQGARVKMDAYEQVLADAQMPDEAAAYVGDDLTDIPVMRRVGLAIAVPDAVSEVLERVHAVTEKRGGHGAVREAAEFILKEQGKWQGILQRYFEPDEGSAQT